MIWQTEPPKKASQVKPVKLCPMFMHTKLFMLNFHLVNNSSVQAFSIIWLHYFQEKTMNWFSPQFCTIVLVWGVWLISLAPWKNLKSKRIKLIRRKGQLNVKLKNNTKKWSFYLFNCMQPMSQKSLLPVITSINKRIILIGF